MPVTTKNFTRPSQRPKSSATKWLRRTNCSTTFKLTTTQALLLPQVSYSFLFKQYTYDELLQSNEDLKKKVSVLKDEISQLRKLIEVVDSDIRALFEDDIKKLVEHQKLFLANQRTQNFMMQKEIEHLESEILDYKRLNFAAHERLAKIEKEVGVQPQFLLKEMNEEVYEDEMQRKFIIQKEEI